MASKYCPKCGQTYPATEHNCRSDQEVLSLKDPYHLVGRTLLDKYSMQALVGLGGMGAVYCAHHLGIDRRVAIKILQPNIAVGNEYVVELFEREAKLAGRLTHENIVDITDAGHTPDGIAYIVMEWLDGRTLDEELASQGRFGFARAIGIIRQITAALGEAHSKRIIHRDLKPANIMLVDLPDGRDHVKVLDFGIGKVIEETTANSPVSAVMGTPQYASPEQLTVGGHIDGRSDIYSLGVIFYRLLGGKLPFSSSSMGELLQMQLTAAPKPLGLLRPGTPAAIEHLVNDMLAKDPAERPQNAAEVLSLLDRTLGQLTADELDSGNLAQASLYASELAEQTTEDIPSPRKLPSGAKNRDQLQARQTSEVETMLSASKPPGRTKSRLLLGASFAAVMLSGSFGLYRYLLDDGQNRAPVNQALADHSESPSPAKADATEPQPVKQAPTSASPRPTITPNQTQANREQAAEHLKRARALYKQGEYQKALRECDESLRLNPQSAEARQLKVRISDVIRILNSR